MMGEPYGGKLVLRMLSDSKRERVLEEARDMIKFKPHIDAIYDAEKIGIGAYSPLEGFMCKGDYDNVIASNRLESGLPWTIPIILTNEDNSSLQDVKEGDDLILLDTSNEPFAILHLEDKFRYDKQNLAKSVYGTVDENHPNVKDVFGLGEEVLGGKIDLIQKLKLPAGKYELSPTETREIFLKKGWKTVVGYQCRNPPHAAHEYLQRCALELVDGLFINPVVGRLKKGDYKPEIILKTYEPSMGVFYRDDRALLSSLSITMRYAGPKASLFLAIVRKNFGCTHYIVGRDQAGARDASGKNYYEPYECHKIFDEYDIGIIPMKFVEVFFCKACRFFASSKTCPHDPDQHMFISQTKIRQMLKEGKSPPSEIIKPEVAEILSGKDILVE